MASLKPWSSKDHGTYLLRTSACDSAELSDEIVALGARGLGHGACRWIDGCRSWSTAGGFVAVCAGRWNRGVQVAWWKMLS